MGEKKLIDIIFFLQQLKLETPKYHFSLINMVYQYDIEIISNGESYFVLILTIFRSDLSHWWTK